MRTNSVESVTEVNSIILVEEYSVQKFHEFSLKILSKGQFSSKGQNVSFTVAD